MGPLTISVGRATRTPIRNGPRHFTFTQRAAVNTSCSNRAGSCVGISPRKIGCVESARRFRSFSNSALYATSNMGRSSTTRDGIAYPLPRRSKISSDSPSQNVSTAAAIPRSSRGLESTSAPSMRRSRVLFSGAGQPSETRLNQRDSVIEGVVTVMDNFSVAAPPR